MNKFDVVQVVKGRNLGVLGIVTSVMGNDVGCWGVAPDDLNNRRYRFSASMDMLRVVGGAFVRPVSKTTGSVPAAAKTPAPAPTPKPAPPPPPPPAPPPPPQPKPQPKPAWPPASDASPHGTPHFGADSSNYKPPVPQSFQEPIDPELLKTAIFKRPSAHDLIPKTPQPQPQGIPDQPPKRRRGRPRKIRPEEQQ